MKPLTWKRLLSLVVTFSAGRVCSGFVAPTTSTALFSSSSSSRREHQSQHASSATALRDTEVAAPMVEQDVLDFAIVGGGPAGLAAAVGLKEKGLAVKVFEAAPRITERGAAVFLQVCFLYLRCSSVSVPCTSSSRHNVTNLSPGTAEQKYRIA